MLLPSKPQEMKKILGSSHHLWLAEIHHEGSRGSEDCLEDSLCLSCIRLILCRKATAPEVWFSEDVGLNELVLRSQDCSDMALSSGGL